MSSFSPMIGITLFNYLMINVFNTSFLYPHLMSFLFSHSLWSIDFDSSLSSHHLSSIHVGFLGFGVLGLWGSHSPEDIKRPKTKTRWELDVGVPETYLRMNFTIFDFFGFLTFFDGGVPDSLWRSEEFCIVFFSMAIGPEELVDTFIERTFHALQTTPICSTFYFLTKIMKFHVSTHTACD